MSGPDEIGDVIVLGWTIKVDGVLTDADVTLTVTQPDGGVLTPTPDHDSAGTYSHPFLIAQNGPHIVRWVATGAANAAETSTFTIGSSLARQSDVEANLGRALTDGETDRISGLLANASRVIRAYCRQDFTYGPTTKVLRITAGKIRLPQRPVTAVSSVKLVGPNGVQRFAVPFTWDGLDQVSLLGDLQVLNLPEILADVYTTTAEVTWTHGYPSLPDDIQQLCAQVVARVLQAPGTPGVSYQSAGPFSYRIADGYNGGQVMLTAEDKAYLDSRGYRRGVVPVGLL